MMFMPSELLIKKGEVKWVEIKVVLIQWDGKPATLNFLSDVSENAKGRKGVAKSKEIGNRLVC